MRACERAECLLADLADVQHRKQAERERQQQNGARKKNMARIGLLNGDYGYSTAVGLFNSVINVILLIFVNWVVKKLNDGEGL